MKISDVSGRGMREDFIEPRIISDDKPWVQWYEGVRQVPEIAGKFGGLPYEKLDSDARLQVKNLHLEATKRQRTLDEAGRDDIYVDDLVALFGKLDAATNQNEANRIQKQVIGILSRASDPQQLAADAFDAYTRTLREQAQPAPKLPQGGWELPSLTDFAKERFGLQPGTMQPPANLNVPQGGTEKAENKVMSSVERWLAKSRLGNRFGPLVKGAATLYMLQNLFGGSPETAQAPAAKPQVGPMGVQPGSTMAPPVASPASPQVGPMGVQPGTAMPPPVASSGAAPMGAAMGAFSPQADKAMGTAIGAMGNAQQDDGPMKGAEFNPDNIVAPAAPAPAAPAPAAPEPAAPAQEPDQPQVKPPPVVAPAAVEPSPASDAVPSQQEPDAAAKAAPISPSGTGTPPPEAEYVPPSPSAVSPQGQQDSAPPQPSDGGYSPSGNQQGTGSSVTPTGNDDTSRVQPQAGSRALYDDPTFKQAFARARQRAEMLPDNDPDKYTFKWRNPKTGEVGDYQTNYRGKGTKRRPQEPYIPQSKQKGYMSTTPIANPYENPGQFKGGKKKKKKKATNEAAWVKRQMLRMNRLAPQLYGDIIREHTRPALFKALMEMDTRGLRDDIDSQQVAELYLLRARKNMPGIDDPHIMEGADPSDIARAISHRLMHTGKAAELVRRHGLDRLMDAIGAVAEFHQGAEELGSSDISIMVKQVLSDLGHDDEYSKAYESANDFIGTIRNAVASAVKGDKRGASTALDAAKNAPNNSNLPIAGGTTPPAKPAGSAAATGSFADNIAKAVDASKKNDKQGMQKAIDAAKAAAASGKPNDPKDRELLAQLAESPVMGDIVIMELADGRLLQSRISELSGNSMVIDMDETGMQWLEESPDHSALRIGGDGRPVSGVAEQWNAMVDDLDHDTPEGWARVFTEHAERLGADPASMPGSWSRIWRQQHEKLGDDVLREDQVAWVNETSQRIRGMLSEAAETDGQFMRHRLSMKDPAMLATWMKSQSGVRGQPVKKFARGVARSAGKPEDAYWSKIRGLVSEKRDIDVDAEDMIAAGFSDEQIHKVTGLGHKHIASLRKHHSSRSHGYNEAAVGYSEPYEVGRKQGMHNIHSNPYSQGSPASQRWSAGHTAAIQGLGEDGTPQADLGREISAEQALRMFGDNAGDLHATKGWSVQFFMDKHGGHWRLIVSPEGRIFASRDTMMEVGMPGSVAKHKKDLNSKTPEELHARFRSVADRQGGASPERIEKLAREMAWRHGYGKMSDHYWKQFGHLVGSPNDIDEAVDKAQAERKLRNRYLGGDPKISWHRGHVKVVAGGKEYHHAIHKGQVEDRPYITSDMEEGKLDAARTIDRFFGGMAESLVRSVIRRAGILAMQGRHGEAEVLLQKAMRDADPAAAKKVTDAVRNIKPVTAGSRTADTGALEKSAEHNDWLDNTFIPWVMRGLGLNEAKYHGKEVPLGKPIRTNTSSGGKFKVYVRDPKTGNIKMVRFGDTTGLSIKRDDPKRRKNFRARHHCDNPGPRTKARYWSCRMWTRKPVGKILKGK